MRPSVLALAASLCGCRESPARPASSATTTAPLTVTSPGEASDAPRPVCGLDNGCALVPCGCACRAFPRGEEPRCEPCATPGDPCEGRRAACHKGRCVAVRVSSAS